MSDRLLYLGAVILTVIGVPLTVYGAIGHEWNVALLWFGVATAPHMMLHERRRQSR